MKSVREWWATSWDTAQERAAGWECNNAQRLPKWRTRRRRKALALVLGFGGLLMVAGAAVISEADAVPFFVLWGAGFLIGGVAMYMLRVVNGKMSSSITSTLDERERSVRNKVYFTGYQVLVAFMLIAMFYMLVIAGQAESGYRGAMMLSVLLVCGICVPSVLLAWTLPDDDPEDLLEEPENA